MEPMILQQPSLFIPSTFPQLIGMNYDTWKVSGDYAGNPVSDTSVPIGSPALPGYSRATSTRTLLINMAGIAFTPETYTVEFWIRPSGQQTVMYWALSNGESLVQFELSGIDTSQGRVATFFTGSTFKSIDIRDTDVMDGGWHHLAIVLEVIETKYHIRFYLDGAHRNFDKSTGSGQYVDPELIRNLPATGLRTNEMDCPFYGNGMVSEVIVWRGIPEYIGNTRPTRGPLGYGL